MDYNPRSELNFNVACFVLFCCLCWPRGLAWADVVTDGTVGASVSLPGPEYLISHDLGTVAGHNLFHSFDTFSIEQGQSATFTGPAELANVISRVTGGTASAINGLLRSSVGTADFYFINPAGVVFGPNAQVDVPAAFHCSTADRISFPDGGQFSASDPGTSRLSTADPSAFGFLSAQPAAIVLNGSRLTVEPGNDFSLSAGDLEIRGDTAASSAVMSPGGRVYLHAVGDAQGQVPVSGSAPLPLEGHLLLESALIETSGDGGGQISIQAGRMDVDSTLIASDNTGPDHSDGGIDIRINGTLSLTSESRIQSNVHGCGNSGLIVVTADNISIAHQSDTSLAGFFSEVEPGAAGDAGDITLDVTDRFQILGSGGAASATFGTGNAGDVVVWATDLDINGDDRVVLYRDSLWSAGVASETGIGAAGDSGAVFICVDNAFSISRNGNISASTLGDGNAGDILVTAGVMALNGPLCGIGSESALGAHGDAGSIAVFVDQDLSLLNGATISSSTWSNGNAGHVDITAGQLLINALDAAFSPGMVTGVFCLAGNPESTGSAGTVAVNTTGLIEILGNEAQIATANWGGGAGGDIFLCAGSLLIDAKQGIGGINTAASGVGSSGKVDIDIENMAEIFNGGTVASSTFFTGEAGDISIHAGDLVMEGYAVIKSETMATQTDNAGNAGSIEVKTDGRLNVMNGSQISCSTYSNGHAGNIRLEAATLQIEAQEAGMGQNGTGVFSQANKIDGNGDAGDIAVTADSGVSILGNNAYISNITFGAGSGGDIVIATGDLRVDGLGGAGGISSGTQGRGHSGDMELTVDNRLDLLNGAYISTSTGFEGNAGQIKIGSGQLHISVPDTIESPDALTGIFSRADNYGSTGNAGQIEILTGGLIEIEGYGAEISASNSGGGLGGQIVVNACDLLIDRFGGITSSIYGSGDAGPLEINIDNQMELLNGARIQNDTYAQGHAGKIQIRAGDLKMEGYSIILSGALSLYMVDTGDAGDIDIRVDRTLDIFNGSGISCSSASNGNAGNIGVTAGALNIYALDAGSVYYQPTGMFSQANNPGLSGSAGRLDVQVDESVEIVGNEALISAYTRSDGQGGDIFLAADSLLIDVQGGVGGISSATTGSGNGGTIHINIESNMALKNGNCVINNTYARGNAGDVVIFAGDLSMTGAALINEAGSLYASDTGHAGNIHITLDDDLEMLKDSFISSSTFSASDQGGAGTISIQAGNARMDERSGIASGTLGNSRAGDIHLEISDSLSLSDTSYITTDTLGSGDAGEINAVTGGSLTLFNGSRISSATRSSGNAGRVVVQAEEIIIDGSVSDRLTGIACRADESAAGQVGNLTVKADEIFISSNGQIDISSGQGTGALADNAPMAKIVLDTGLLHLDSGARITSESYGNAPAAAIELKTGKLILENGSRITTDAWQANGGPVTIQGQAVIMRNGLITTSVAGASGDGGDIVLTGSGGEPADAIVFQNGFVQANTAAPDARGGDILVNARSVIADGNDLMVGSDQRQTFEMGSGMNVIQAAAPGGEQGTIDVTAPELDISGALVKTALEFFDPALLATDPCSIAGGQGNNSLVFSNQGVYRTHSGDFMDISWKGFRCQP